MVTLRQILEEIDAEAGILRATGTVEREIMGVTPDSRSVRPGWLFVAVAGAETDGHRFVADAVQRGAAAVMVERIEGNDPLAARTNPPALVCVTHGRRAMALAAAVLHGWPARSLRMIGVTGTNGKTTITYLIRSLLRAAGRRVGLMGTIGYAIDDDIVPASHTTPESVVLQEWLGRMRVSGIQDVVMEVSSHALALERVAGCEYDVAVFSNLSQDHLDFHHSMEDYLAAKTRLFQGLFRSGHKTGEKRAVINGDDAYGRRILEEAAGPVWSYGLGSGADIRAEAIEATPQGIAFHCRTPRGTFVVRSPLLGRYNVHNILAAVAAGLHLGVTIEQAQAGVAALAGVPGRFERVEAGQPFTVVVDFAHTEDALGRLLAAARELRPRRILTVFGCGGERDAGKRGPMGRVAARLSDWVVATSDNPRREDPRAILSAVEAGIRAGMAYAGAAEGYDVIPDRRQAIERAISLAQPGDMVVLAGKGHEQYQVIGQERLRFDDRVEARAALVHLGKASTV